MNIKSLVFILFLCIQAHAQRIGWLPFKGENFEKSSQSIVGTDAQGIYIYSQEQTKAMLTKHTHQNGNIVYSTPIEFVDRLNQVQDITIFADSTSIFYSTFNPFKTKTTLWCMRAPNATNAQTTLPRRLSEVSNTTSEDDEINHNIRITKDLKTVVAIEVFSPNARKKSINILFFDQNLQRTNEYTYQASYNGWQISVQDFLLDEAGNAFFVVAYKNEMQRRNSLNQTYYEVLKCYKNGQKMVKSQNISVPLPHDDLHLKISQATNQVSLIGFYFELKNEVFDGIMYQHFTADSLQNIGASYVAFTENLRSKFAQTFAERNSRLSDLSILKILNRSDSGLVVIAEVNYKVAQNMSFGVNPAMGRELFYKHFGEIVVFCTAANGTVAWEQLIPKTQVCREDSPFGSFALLQKTDRLSFFFNEDLDLKSPLYQVDITNIGELKPKGVVAENFIGFFGNGKQITDKSLWIQGIKKREKGILKITEY